jgi:LysM repeat protein
MKTARMMRRSVCMVLLLVPLLSAGLLLPAQPLLAAPEAAVAAAPLADTVYLVKAGDTLYRIARNFGTTVNAIMAYNGLTSTTIYVGQRLYIPGTPPPADSWWYQVNAGDTLYRLARRYGTTVNAIMNANGLTSTTIYIGQWLRIPGYTSPAPTVIRYQIRYGDTLSQIARRYGTTVNAIMAYNGLTSTRIYAGRWLLIPTW